MSFVQTTVPKVATKAGRSTPTILYTWAAVVALLCVVVAGVGFVAVATMASTGDRIENSTGPVLISTQGLVGSIAEADAANSTVFLSAIDGGDEDVSQRRLYESAIARAPQQIEDISAGIGDDEATHDALKRVAQQLTTYAGVVEQARFANLNRVGDADALLADSLELTGGTNGMLSNAEEVSTRTRAQFQDDVSAGNLTVIAALVVTGLTLIVLFVAQVRLKARTQRVLNLGLIASMLCIAALFGWILIASALRSGDLAQAESEGFGDITASAELLTAAFDFKTREANAIIAADASLLPDAELGDEIGRLLETLSSANDTARERALANEVQQRWLRYQATSEETSAAVRSGQIEVARTLVAGRGNQDFNGFNTTAEALSLLNQDEFTASVLDANARVRWLNVGALALPLLAAVFAWLGYRPRISEYF